MKKNGIEYCDCCGMRSPSFIEVYTSFDNAKAGRTKRYCVDCKDALKEQNKRDLFRVKEAIANLQEVYYPSVQGSIELLEEFEMFLHRDPTKVASPQPA